MVDYDLYYKNNLFWWYLNYVLTKQKKNEHFELCEYAKVHDKVFKLKIHLIDYNLYF